MRELDTALATEAHALLQAQAALAEALDALAAECAMLVALKAETREAALERQQARMDAIAAVQPGVLFEHTRQLIHRLQTARDTVFSAQLQSALEANGAAFLALAAQMRLIEQAWQQEQDALSITLQAHGRRSRARHAYHGPQGTASPRFLNQQR